MPSLSFEKKDKDDLPVAIVEGGKYDKKILYMHDETITKGKSKAKKGSTPRTPAGGAGAAESDSDEEKTEKRKPEIRLDDGKFEILPTCDPDKRCVYYIAGQSGSGKSFVAKTLANFYHKLFPDRGIYLVSKLEKDDTLDALPFIKRIKIQSLIDDYPSIDEFKDTLTLWDDFDTLTGDAKKVVHKLIEDLCIMGRHTNSSMAIMSHYLSNYKETRLILSEATHMVVYPMSTSPTALKRTLSTYVGVDDDDISRQRRYGSRWLMYKKGFPMFCLSQYTAEMLFC